MTKELTEEDIRKARAIMESYLAPDELEQMKKLISSEVTTTLTGEQRQAIRNLFQAFGYLESEHS